MSQDAPAAVGLEACGCVSFLSVGPPDEEMAQTVSELVLRGGEMRRMPFDEALNLTWLDKCPHGGEALLDRKERR